MSPVDELRSAAVLLRQRAEEATPGPWQHTGSGIGQDHMGCGEVFTLGDGVEGGAIAAPAGDCYPRGGYSPAEDMAWIATMHPGVGEALADLLDEHADHIEDIRKHGTADALPLMSHVTLARLVNGGGS